jgi:hypothetical protein
MLNHRNTIVFPAGLRVSGGKRRRDHIRSYGSGVVEPGLTSADHFISQSRKPVKTNFTGDRAVFEPVFEDVLEGGLVTSHAWTLHVCFVQKA